MSKNDTVPNPESATVVDLDQKTPPEGDETKPIEDPSQPQAEAVQTITGEQPAATPVDLSAFFGVPIQESTPEVDAVLYRPATITNEGFRQMRRDDRSMFVEAYQTTVPDGAGGSRQETRAALVEGFKFQTYEAMTQDESRSMNENHVQAQASCWGYPLQMVTQPNGTPTLKRDALGHLLLASGGRIVLSEDGHPLRVEGQAPIHLYQVNAQLQMDDGKLLTNFMAKDKSCVIRPQTRTRANGTTYDELNAWNINMQFHPALVVFRNVLRAARDQEPLATDSQAVVSLRNFALSIPKQKSVAEAQGTLQQVKLGEATPAVNSQQVQAMIFG